MTPERTAQKQIHARVRQALRSTYFLGGPAQRYALLLWGFVRGFPYRRIERGHRMQRIGVHRQMYPNHPSTRPESEVLFEHNLPKLDMLQLTYESVLGERADRKRLRAWLDDPSGAISAPLPLPRVKAGELWRCGAVRFRVSDVAPNGEALVYVESAQGQRRDAEYHRARIFLPAWERLEMVVPDLEALAALPASECVEGQLVRVLADGSVRRFDSTYMARREM